MEQYTQKEFVDLFDILYEFTSEELKSILWNSDVEIICEEEGYEHRWWREIYTVFEACGRYFSITWNRGLTENQENEWPYQPVEVKKVEKVVTKTEVTWEPIEG